MDVEVGAKGSGGSKITISTSYSKLDFQTNLSYGLFV